MATVPQIKIAQLLDIDVSSDSFLVAAARILDIVGPAIGEEERYEKPTAKQLAVAPSLGLDISADSYRVAFAKIRDRYNEINATALERLQLEPGDIVLRHNHVVVEGQHCDCPQSHSYDCGEFTVSSIRDETVYFRGMDSHRAWGGQLTLVRRSRSA